MPVAYRTQNADNDLRNIAYQVGVESSRPLTAERIVDELIDCCNQLAELSPIARLGTAASQIGPGVRLFTHRRWVIIFRYVNDDILVLRVADGGQDYLSWRIG
jgi:plasmid stabilization system protein ParE